MEKEKRTNLIFFVALTCFFGFILFAFSVHIYETGRFNEKERFVFDDEVSECTIKLYPRAGLADSWEKRDIEFNEEIVNFTGITYDCQINNFSDSVVSDWKLTINIIKECYINNSWCGTVEVHQHVNGTGDEIVQEIDLRNYDKNSIRLEHFYVSQDLYIPLEYGDYIVYNPSQVSGELPVKAFSDEAGRVVIGFIFYHKKGSDLDFSTVMQYKLNRGYFQGTKPKLLVMALAVWVMILVIRITFVLTFSNLKRETASVIHAISRIYTFCTRPIWRMTRSRRFAQRNSFTIISANSPASARRWLLFPRRSTARKRWRTSRIFTMSAP